MADTLAALRSLMASHTPPLDALVVPSEDYHQSEYVSARDKRRAFVSGFTGSAGLALVTKNEALLWTDGRYFLQAEQQLSDEWKLMRMGEDPSVELWISTTLPEASAIGIDFWCISAETAQKWKSLFAKKQQNLVPTTRNLVDEVWKDQPQAEINPVHVHPLKFSGRSVSDKLKDLRDNLKKEKARGIIVTSLDEVVWLYNVRGSDVSYSPVVHAFAVVTTKLAFFYVDERKLSSEVKSYMEENKIIVKDYNAVSSDVALLASNQLTSAKDLQSNDASETEVSSQKIWVDPRCCYSLYSLLRPDQILLQPSPLALPKSLKNPVEMEGLKNAHIRDGAAVVQYFAWLDKQMKEIYGASGYFKESESQNSKNHSGDAKLTEVSVSDKLEEFRASKEHFRGLSFPTISSVGPNGAIIHYGPQAKTCAELDPNSMYLCDSGAQYLDGTTDITRTVHFGKPSEHEKRCYTAVLKGHIALGNARFPNGTTGHALDVLARVPLWSYGLDYRHGTGHGIGSYLNVHEGPHSITFRPGLSVPLQASMTVTDEPGYYEDGKFGIRLENVLIIKEAATQFNYANKGYLEFEHITWAPYQTKLIDASLLLPEEIKWVNSYHMKCRDILAPYLNESDKAWLNQATEPIAA
ncbi:putative xaa-Pro aminopeptidase [Helianthus annuus]|uniref:Xaa-Pro aminopeptidase n=1 Tax=Helianthus annuus TaxID=4232 RepID=A0A251TC82_HELAN|nr:aminopeptidase P1 [Helianthus annuus]KAF5765109.1 putative xaa-Pro aminopeptidase [Helianthus annuus]KAJ0451681.1 putative xaa-Pro aminopeptidase [Helianthus annuus]KAJ0456319.1 putative xaa-Pro aminopeptidase [Helianthus annuus]KAJ0473567.1 putative xaa-Pro aminopeptidase [Helianthus annuus]KAJ0649145.1 putative xaa-Pro aminopeptidase [Helianthus annuus]